MVSKDAALKKYLREDEKNFRKFIAAAKEQDASSQRYREQLCFFLGILLGISIGFLWVVVFKIVGL